MKRNVVLLLHGWIREKNAKDYYANTILEFEKRGYEVLIPDMPGFGKTTTPKHPLTLQDYAIFVYKYLHKLNVEPNIVIGHSFGGRVIIEYLSLFPCNVKTVVLSGTPGYPSIKKSKMLLSLLIAKIGGTIVSLPLISKLKERIRGWYYYIVGARDFYRAEGAMRQTFKNIVTESLDEKMKNMNVPTLLIWGENDVIVPVGVAKKMQQAIQNVELSIIPFEGHSVITSKPDRFVDEVIRFTKNL